MIAVALGSQAMLVWGESGTPPEATQSVSAVKPNIVKKSNIEFPGIAWESMRVFPEFILSATRDDNIYATRSGEVEDNVFTFAPSLAVRSDWKQHELNFDVGANIDRYQDYTSEDVNDYWLGSDGSLDVTEQTKVFGGLRHTREHEDRFVPGAAGPELQAEPTLYDHDEAHVGIATRSGPLRLRAGGTFDRYDYQDAKTTAGVTIHNEDRRHDLASLGARAGYVLSPGYEAFVQYASDRRRYDNPIKGTSFNRDSDGYSTAGGLSFSRADKRLTGEVYAGRMHQEFDHAGFSDVDKPYFGGLTVWRPVPVVTVTGYVDRVLEETTVSDGTGYAAASLDTTYGVEVERELSNRLSVVGRFSHTRSQFQSYDREDRVLDAGAGLRYYVSPTVFVGGDLRVIDRGSNDQEAEYRRSQLMFSLGYTPARARNYAIATLAPDSQALQFHNVPAAGLFSGPYVGAAIGHGVLASETSGARDGGGSDVSPMGDAGSGQALFAGYGLEFNRWYLGMEAELEQSQADWSFSKGKVGARTAALEKDDGYGLSLRAGRVVDNGSLLYVRLGGVRTDFQSYYTVNDPSSVAYDGNDTQDGWRVGLGADVPAGERLFLRMEYAYTKYDDYDALHLKGTGLAVENFDPEEGQFRLGMGWRLGGTAAKAPLRPAVRGFYAGAHVGHGGIDSRLDGLHSETGVPPLSQPFNGDFAGMGGVYGVFAGYGINFDRWYAGLEAEVDTAQIDWTHVRETSGQGGRDFSVEKKSDYGVALRLGYTLPNGTLLYGRAGPVRGRFNTTWAKGNNSSADVDRSDVVDGMRYGVGAEIPLSQYSFVRLDYTRTDYDSYGFRTTHANPDDMKFDNSESLFRMGLGFRF